MTSQQNMTLAYYNLSSFFAFYFIYLLLKIVLRLGSKDIKLKLVAYHHVI